MEMPPFRLRWQHHLLAAGVYLALLLAWAPASLLAWALPQLTGQAVWLDQAQGSVWRGEAARVRMELANGADIQLGRIHWRLKPLDLFRGRLAYRLELSGTGIDAAGVLSAGRRDMRVQALRAELPTSVLETLSSDFALWQPGGRLLLETSLLVFRSTGVEGRATLRWIDAVSGWVRTPLGSYRAEFDGNESGVGIKLSTESGALQLQGTGSWSARRGLAWVGSARGELERGAELEGLLSLIGPAQADGSRTLRIDH